MKKILFACDMDNTLIHSARLYKENDISVEIYDGREISFMSPKAIELLNELLKSDKVDFLPVTTRSIAQFSRIQLPSSVNTALVCNGTILLKDGIPDEKWQEKAAAETEKYLPEMEQLCKKYEGSGLFRTVKIVDGMFLFAARENSDGIEKLAEQLTPETTLNLEVTGRKMYWFTPIANKGISLKHYCEVFGYERIIAAGDSSIDYQMMNFAGTALVPDKETAEKINAAVVNICGDESIAEFRLEY
ncbi:MAG: HAD hydrolase family protein, partial [Oscillospiraceae bacterium]|nr:HAD hydrolase family protein [Oscillospiraceae bacterium]